MRAELKRIESNDHPRWSDFVESLQMTGADAGDSSGWFTVEIGPDDGIDAGEMFQVLVVTPAAIPRLKSTRGEFRCIVSQSFDPDTIVSTICEHVAAISASSWAEIRECLRKSMWWEWEKINAV